MNRMASHPGIKDRYHYVAHAFADKQKVLPLQAADLLAWQWYTEMKRQLAGMTTSRKDLTALIKGNAGRYDVMVWTPDHLRDLIPIVNGAPPNAI